jgi:hypothetical protein
MGNARMDKSRDNQDQVVYKQIESIGSITPHNKAIYEAGKSILIDSIATTRGFCKSMINISTGAIPIYLGILSYLLPNDYSLGITAGITLAMPAIGYLITATIFIFGYLPIEGKFTLNIVDQIELERNRIIEYRRKLIIAGVIAFVTSTLLAIGTIIINIGAR